MAYLPLTRMTERAENNAHDSDTTAFFEAMLVAEMVLKCWVAGMVACVEDDRDRHRYRLVHRAVRADGVGEWASILEDALSGPASQYLSEGAQDIRREVTQRVGHDTWQAQACIALNNAAAALSIGVEPVQAKVQLRRWAADLPVIRNKSNRGHGALPAGVMAAAHEHLRRSTSLIVEHLQLFQKPWAFLYRNLSGRYRVSQFAGLDRPFDYLKSTATTTLPDGVYLHVGSARRVDLLTTNADLRDFFVPNGGFNGKRYDLLSYISGDRKEADAQPYNVPASELPPSETEGRGTLDPEGACWVNLPPVPRGYVNRPALEAEILRRLEEENHPVVTLHGPGGAGKTSAALFVLHELAKSERFEVIVWFSSRDIELTNEGPRPVRAKVLTLDDIAEEYCELVQPPGREDRGFDHVGALRDALGRTNGMRATLFVFDNFETVRNPAELHTWLDTYIRAPNKIAITTRFRDFKGDFPVEVGGMNMEEFRTMVVQHGRTLSLNVSEDYVQRLFDESDGHPYVAKILMGESARSGTPSRIARVVATREEILTALFERTFSNLGPAARRIFLTLCSWRSLVPRVAVEAILVRPANDRMDVSAGINELLTSSLIEAMETTDGQFLGVPVAAATFGKRHLEVSPMRAAVQADAALLMLLGTTQRPDLRHGVARGVDRLFRQIAKGVSNGSLSLAEIEPVLLGVCQQFPDAWLLLAKFYGELGASPGKLESARDAALRYVQFLPAEDQAGRLTGWRAVSEISHTLGDALGEAHALAELGTSQVPFDELSAAVFRINALLRDGRLTKDLDERKLLLRQLAEGMEARITEGDATDFSRLAWLYLNLHDVPSAQRAVERARAIDPFNYHISGLVERLFSD